jgi:hypothetical protein
MRSQYSVVLIGGPSIVQVIDLNTSIRNAKKVFFSLSFAAVGSPYDEIHLYSGERQINKTTLKK